MSVHQRNKQTKAHLRLAFYFRQSTRIFIWLASSMHKLPLVLKGHIHEIHNFSTVLSIQSIYFSSMTMPKHKRRIRGYRKLKMHKFLQTRRRNVRFSITKYCMLMEVLSYTYHTDFLQKERSQRSYWKGPACWRVEPTRYVCSACQCRKGRHLHISPETKSLPQSLRWYRQKSKKKKIKP